RDFHVTGVQTCALPIFFDRIGKGGMAEIFLARTTTEFGGSRLVVVKQILPHLVGVSGFADLLVAEAKLAARLNHANIVQILDLRSEERRVGKECRARSL